MNLKLLIPSTLSFLLFSSSLYANQEGPEHKTATEKESIYRKGKHVATSLPQESVELSQLRGVLTTGNKHVAYATKAYRIALPEIENGLFFTRDNRKGDHQWPNNTNRLLPWYFEEISKLSSSSYKGIPSNGLPSTLGDAALLKLKGREFIFLKGVAGTNAISFLEATPTGDLVVQLATMGNDTPDAYSPLLLYAKGATAYDAIREAYDLLIKDIRISSTLRREDKKYAEPFHYLGWCSWEHYHFDIDETKLLRDLNRIEQSEIPIRYVLVDDGYVDFQQQQLMSLTPDSAKFKTGWHSILSHKKEDKIKWIGLWANFTGYWNGISENNHLPDSIQNVLFPFNGTLLPGDTPDKIQHFYNYYLGTLKGYGFDFIKMDNQSFMLPLYMGSAKAIENAKQCNLALENAAKSHGLDLMNCMAHNTLNTDNTKFSAVTRVSIDYKKLDKDMARSHLYQSYQNTLLLGQTVWPDHDMFHSCDNICGKMMARSKAVSGGPVYLSDNPAEFVPENIWPLIDNEGKIFRPLAPAIPLSESILNNALYSGKPYVVGAPLPNDAMTLIAYNFNVTDTIIKENITKAHYSERNHFLKEETTFPKKVLLFDPISETATPLNNAYSYELNGFTDQMFHLLPIVEGWGVIGIKEKYLAPATVEIVSRTKKYLKLNVLTTGTLLIWKETRHGGKLKAIPITEPGTLTVII